MLQCWKPKTENTKHKTANLQPPMANGLQRLQTNGYGLPTKIITFEPMDDIQTILYIAIGIIYLVARALKRKKPQMPPVDPGEQVPEAEESTERRPQRKRPLSFDELIKEISGQAAEPEPEPEPEPDRHRRPLVSDTDAQATYEKSIDQAKRIRKKGVASHAKMERIRLFQDQDEKVTERNYLAEDIADSLKNNWDIKKAIVINEILTRKYD